MTLTVTSTPSEAVAVEPTVKPRPKAPDPVPVAAKIWRAGAFVLNENVLRALFAVMDEFTGEPARLRIYASDGLNRYYDTIDELLTYHNAHDAQIWDLEIGKGENWIKFSIKPEDSYTLFGELYGSEHVVLERRKKILRHVQGLSPWYGIAAVILNGSSWLAAIPLVVLGASSLATNWPRVVALPKPPIFVVFVFGILLALGWTAYISALKWLFPVGAYDIGHGQQRYRHQELARGTLVLGVLTSGAYSLIQWLAGF